MFLEGSNKDVTSSQLKIMREYGYTGVKVLYNVKKLNKVCYNYNSAVDFYNTTELDNKFSLEEFLSKKFPNG